MTSIYIRLQLQFRLGMWASGKIPFTKSRNFMNVFDICCRFLKLKYDYIITSVSLLNLIF